MSQSLSIVEIIAIIATLVAAVWDIRYGLIPNWLTFPLLGLGPLLQLVLWWPSWKDALIQSGLGIVVCGAVPYFLFRQGAMGGGDVKLLAALGGLLGYMQGLEVELLALFAMLIFALAKLAWDGKLLRVLSNVLFMIINPILPKTKRREIRQELMTSMRFGGAILVGAIVSAVLQGAPTWM